jgi:hypothetical protein
MLVVVSPAKTLDMNRHWRQANILNQSLLVTQPS